MLTMAMDKSFSDDNAICYVRPVLWISCFHIIGTSGACHKFPTHSPGVAMLFDFIVVYTIAANYT